MDDKLLQSKTAETRSNSGEIRPVCTDLLQRLAYGFFLGDLLKTEKKRVFIVSLKKMLGLSEACLEPI